MTMPTRSSPFKGEFTPTSIEEYLSCKRKYYFKKCMGLKPVDESVSANYGTCIHAGVGAFYANQGKTLEQRTGIAVAAFVKEWESYGLEGDEKRSLSGGITTLNEYCKAYQRDAANFDPKFIEVSQSIEMPNKTLLIMRIDRVSKTGDSTMVFDTKTTSMAMTNFYFGQFENSFQLSCYHYTVNTIIEDSVDCIVIDAIKVPYTTGKQRKTGEPIENFVRHSYMRTDIQIEEFLNTYNRVTGEIVAALSEPEEQRVKFFHQCPTACGNYGGCKYLSICKYGFSHPSTKVDFVREEVTDDNT